MARFFLGWEIDRNKAPSDPKATAAGWSALAGLVRQDLESGQMKDWGAFPGSATGYCVVEGSNTELMTMTMRYAPFVIFDVRPVAGVSEVAEVLAAAANR